MKKILIVEDDAELQNVYKDALSAEGFEVLQSQFVQDALALTKKEKPSLILLDIMLPGGKNGFDMLEELKQDHTLKKIPVLMLTNLDTEKKVAKQIGAEDYIVKANTSIEEVIQKIKRALT